MLKPDELKFIRKLNTSSKVQEFVDTLTYNSGDRVSVLDVLRAKKADCLEAASLAHFILKMNGFKSFLIDLSAIRDEDHVICVFEIDGLYGGIAQSKFLNLRYRHPVYKNLRELAMSYFDSYFNYSGFYSLRSYSKMELDYLPDEWIESAKWIRKIENNFSDIEHEMLVPRDIKLPSVSKEKFKREILLFPKNVKIGKKYK
jgi:hypothetical protein